MDPNFNRNSPSFFYSCHFTKLFMFLFLYNYINTVKRKRNLNRKERQHRKRYTTHLWLMNDLLKFKWYARATKARDPFLSLLSKIFLPNIRKCFLFGSHENNDKWYIKEFSLNIYVEIIRNDHMKIKLRQSYSSTKLNSTFNIFLS